MTFSTCNGVDEAVLQTDQFIDALNDLSISSYDSSLAEEAEPEPGTCELEFDFSEAVRAQEIGTGATSRVCIADVPTSKLGCSGCILNTRMAVKMVAATSHGSFQREKEALTALEGVPSVVRCYGSLAIHSQKKKEEECEDVLGEGRARRRVALLAVATDHLLFLEYLKRGDLFTLLSHHPRGLPSEAACAYCREVVSCVAACHAHGVQHRDIKPENLLVAADGTLRLADFGNALVGHRTTASDLCGTAAYLAPEVGRGPCYDPRAADVWSAGIVCFAILFGVPPFYQANSNCWYFRCVRDCRWPRFWLQHDQNQDHVSHEAMRFIERALTLSPEHRPSATELLADPFLTGKSDADFTSFAALL